MKDLNHNDYEGIDKLFVWVINNMEFGRFYGVNNHEKEIKTLIDADYYGQEIELEFSNDYKKFRKKKKFNYGKN